MQENALRETTALGICKLKSDLLLNFYTRITAAFFPGGVIFGEGGWTETRRGSFIEFGTSFV